MLHNPDKKLDVVAEESNQIKELETQISSQPKIEEVKQAQAKERKLHRLKRKSLIEVKSFSRLSKLITKIIYPPVEETTMSSPTLLA